MKDVLDIYRKIAVDQAGKGIDAKVGYCSEERHDEILTACIGIARYAIGERSLSHVRILDVGAGCGSLCYKLQSKFRHFRPDENYYGIEYVHELWKEFRFPKLAYKWENDLFWPSHVRQFSPDIGFMIGTVSTFENPFPLLESVLNTCSLGVVVSFLDESKYKSSSGAFIARDIPAMFKRIHAMSKNVIVSTLDRSETVFFIGK